MKNRKKNLVDLVGLSFEQKAKALRNLKKRQSALVASMPGDCMCTSTLSEYARNLSEKSGLKIGLYNKSPYFLQIRTSTDYQTTNLIISRR